MKIAIVTETFLPKIDGIVTMVTKTVETLKALGDEVLIFAPSGGKIYARSQTANGLGLRYVGN